MPRAASRSPIFLPGEHTIELWHEPVAAGGAPVVSTQVVKVADGKVTAIEPVLEL